MSMESAKAYMERMKNDEDFRKKVTECKNNEERKFFVVSEGFDFSVEDIKQASGELSEEELDKLSGGLRILPRCQGKVQL